MSAPLSARGVCSQLISPEEGSAADAWGLVVSFSSYLALCTLQQLFHTGIGHGQRRVGKRRRLTIRCVFIPATIAFHVARQGRDTVHASTEFIAYASTVTALALFELCAPPLPHIVLDPHPFSPFIRNHAVRRGRWGRGRAASLGSLLRPRVMRPLSAGLLAGQRQESKMFWQEQLPGPGDSTRKDSGGTLDARLAAVMGGSLPNLPLPAAAPAGAGAAPRRELNYFP